MADMQIPGDARLKFWGAAIVAAVVLLGFAWLINNGRDARNIAKLDKALNTRIERDTAAVVNATQPEVPKPGLKTETNGMAANVVEFADADMKMFEIDYIDHKYNVIKSTSNPNIMVFEHSPRCKCRQRALKTTPDLDL